MLSPRETQAALRSCVMTALLPSTLVCTRLTWLTGKASPILQASLSHSTTKVMSSSVLAWKHSRVQLTHRSFWSIQTLIRQPSAPPTPLQRHPQPFLHWFSAQCICDSLLAVSTPVSAADRLLEWTFLIL